MAFRLITDAFAESALIPKRFTCEGQDCKSCRHDRSKAACKPRRGPVARRAANVGTRHVEHAGVALRDHINVAVLAFHIHRVVGVNRRSVNAPLEAVRMIRDTAQATVRIVSTAIHFGTVKLPLGNEMGVELSDVERPRRNPVSMRGNGGRSVAS